MRLLIFRSLMKPKGHPTYQHFTIRYVYYGHEATSYSFSASVRKSWRVESITLIYFDILWLSAPKNPSLNPSQLSHPRFLANQPCPKLPDMAWPCHLQNWLYPLSGEISATPQVGFSLMCCEASTVGHVIPPYSAIFEFNTHGALLIYCLMITYFDVTFLVPRES